MGYLVCDKCGGYYELKEGEKPEDFSDKCECGGKLRYVENLNETKPVPPITHIKDSAKEINNNEKDKGEKKDNNSSSWLGLGVACCVGLILIIAAWGLIFPEKTVYATYTSPQMSFQYPQGWNVTPMNGNNSVEIKKGNTSFQVLYLGDTAALANESVALEQIGDKFEGYYKENTTNTTYKVYKSPNNGGQEYLFYLFWKNSKSYEIRAISPDDKTLDYMDHVIATIQ